MGQADVHPQLRLILPDAGPGCEKNGRRATWPVTTRSGRHQVPVAVLPTAKSLSAFSLKPQSDRLLERGLNPDRLGAKLRPNASASLSRKAAVRRGETETRRLPRMGVNRQAINGDLSGSAVWRTRPTGSAIGRERLCARFGARSCETAHRSILGGTAGKP